jgi:hypothetical protein
MHHATRSELEQYEKLGFFHRERVLSGDDLEALREGAEHAHQRILEAAERGEGGPIDVVDNQRYQGVCGSTVKWEWDPALRAARSMEPVHQLDARLEAAIDDPRFWQPAADVIGCATASLFSDKLNVKRPGGAPFPWHQEGPYWAYGAQQLDKIVSVLVYLDDATKENGCLWVIAGSHTRGTLQGLRDRGVLGALYTDVDLIDGEAVPVELPAGSAIWFHRDLVHGSQSNRSQTSRRVFVLAYQPPGLSRWRMGRNRDVRV